MTISQSPISDSTGESLERDGFTILPAVLDAEKCDAMATEIAVMMSQPNGNAIESSGGGIVGGRNLLSLWNGWRAITSAPIVESLVHDNLGSSAGVVRILFFDKPPGKGWALSLHKDRTIAVKQHVQPINPFSKPTRKAGVPHVQASEKLLREMLTLRLHLDPMHDHNGPVVVVPGSHQSAKQNDNREEVRVIHCNLGDVFVMRPLLSHGSRSATAEVEDHRRVVHLECAPFPDLPGEYEWHDFVTIRES